MTRAGDALNEDRVKDITEEWLRTQLEVEETERELTLVKDGSTADIVARDANGDLNWVIECKGGQGGINTVVAGLGQCAQYVYQLKLRRRRVKDVSRRVQVALFLPSSLGETFKALTIPSQVDVCLIDPASEVPRILRPARPEVEVAVHIPGTSAVGAYLRETQVDDFGKIMVVVNELSRKHRPGAKISRKAICRIVRRRYSLPGWGYNHLITMSNLGLLSSRNQLTVQGHRYLDYYLNRHVKYEKEIVRTFLPLMLNCQDALLRLAWEKDCSPRHIECSLFEIVDRIQKTWGGEVKSLEDRRNVGAVLRLLEDLTAVDRHGDNDYGLRHLVHHDYLPVESE